MVGGLREKAVGAHLHAGLGDRISKVLIGSVWRLGANLHAFVCEVIGIKDGILWASGDAFVSVWVGVGHVEGRVPGAALQACLGEAVSP